MDTIGHRLANRKLHLTVLEDLERLPVLYEIPSKT
jgi:hypothetical protein